MYIRKVLFAIKLALVLVLCFVIVITVIMPQHPARIFTPTSAVGTENASALGTASPAEPSVVDYSAIIEQNIFGGKDSSFGADKSLWSDKTDVLVPSAEEELGLALVGTVCGSPAVSRAIIKDTKTDLLDLYKVGQTVADARIKSIEENAVILLHKGQEKILTLNITGRGSENNPQALSSHTINDTSKIVKPILPVEQPSAEIAKKIAQVDEILTNAVIEPYAVNGQIEGLRITGLEKIPMAKDLGFKNGDIIRVVNGHRLTGKREAYQIFKKARAQEAINLELLRGGETKQLSFALR